jgi:hypothetical protein
MQIVPYMPIHPSQLGKDSPVIDDKTEDESLFKIPSIPTPYTVEEPCDSAIKRPPTMKRYE